MRSTLLVVLLCLSLFYYLTLHIAVLNEGAPPQPLSAATFLATIRSDLRAIVVQVRDFAQGLFDAVATPQRERIQRRFPLRDVEQ